MHKPGPANSVERRLVSHDSDRDVHSASDDRGVARAFAVMYFDRPWL